MLTEQQLIQARENLEELTRKKLEGKLELAECDHISIVKTADGYKVGAPDYAQLSRALLSIMKSQAGEELKSEQTAFFDDCGVMLDCSRNAVSTVETVKKLIRFISACGMNMLMLYTEDTYEIPEEPMFGYMRGRYSTEELKEIDAYAQKYGIELIPCIQTLGHLRTFLNYNHFDIRDNADTLLCDEEKTYEFIENSIKAVRNAFSSKRIHIGMDEAYSIGRGKYLDKFGYRNGFDILNDHLQRVTGICKKYGFEPMMWSDMFFKLGSKNHEYYDTEAHISPEIAAMIPDCAMVYWDYYHDDKNFYSTMIKNHKDMNKPVYFAGGFSCWYGALPRYISAYDSSVSALEACVEQGIKTVFATMWGDDGNDCNLGYDLPYITIYGEYMYRGASTTKNDIDSTVRLLCGYGLDKAKALGSLDMARFENDPLWFTAKRLLFSDPFYALGLSLDFLPTVIKVYEECRDIINKDGKSGRADVDKLFEYAELVYYAAETKAHLMLDIRAAYDTKNIEKLREIADIDINVIIGIYADLARNHRNMWNATYKPFGYEIHAHRYGGEIMRFMDIAETINDFCDGKLSTIAELDVPLQNTDFRYGVHEVESAGVL